MEYKLIKTKGKKLKLYVDRDGTVVVKVPRYTKKSTVDAFVDRNIRWIENKRREHRKKAIMGMAPTEQQIKALKKQAADIMGRKTEYYAVLLGVKPDAVKITSAQKRWGSCTRKGKNIFTVCYSYRVMFLSDRCRDYIAVHELCHIKHMNHSKAFYSCIEQIIPDYREIMKEISEYPDYDLYPASAE